MKLLTRDQFRTQVFERDNHTCVFCDKPAIDAHHIIERQLFTDGGYYLINGASVCEQHHLDCEKTIISVEDVRKAAGITKKVLPGHLYPDQIYDKWGNPILSNGMRVRGELFEDKSIQRILDAGNVLHLFTKYVKFPRTYHLPWSKSIRKDDRVLKSTNQFNGREVIVTEKMDGENFTLYDDYCHARSIYSNHYPSRSWIKNFWSQICYSIPTDWRVCGENLYAKHSIAYDELESYFYGFHIWNEKNECLSWDETKEWFALLGIQPVPVFYRGIFDKEKIHLLFANTHDTNTSEGYVIRIADKISYQQYSNRQALVGKFVRKGHMQTEQHLIHGQHVVPNRLKQ